MKAMARAKVRSSPRARPSRSRRGSRPTGLNVGTKLVHRVEDILKSRGGPVSRNEIMRALAANGHGLTRPRLNAALSHLDRYGVIEDGGPDGVVWLGRPSRALVERFLRSRKK